MPLYAYRCRTCDTSFDLRRPMAEADAAAVCPEGHEGAVRLLAAFASTGRASSSSAGAPAAPMPAGGCGAACGCG